MIRRFDRVIKAPLAGAGVSGTDREKLRPGTEDRIERVLITRKLIRKRVQALAAQIAESYKGDPRLDVVFVLEGAGTFATDLAQAIYDAGGPEVLLHSIKARTYGAEIKAGEESFRPVKIFYAPEGLQGKKVLLVEDIVDQGFTLLALRNFLLKDCGATEVKICALLDKKLSAPTPEVKKSREQLVIDFTGFEVPDHWVAGYGIDAGGDFRFLPFVVVVKEAYYKRGGRT